MINASIDLTAICVARGRSHFTLIMHLHVKEVCTLRRSRDKHRGHGGHELLWN